MTLPKDLAEKIETMKKWTLWQEVECDDLRSLGSFRRGFKGPDLEGTETEVVESTALDKANEKLDALETLGGNLFDAMTKENPEWKTCEHDYEPNTAMNYFRCDKCGIRPFTQVALKKWEKR